MQQTRPQPDRNPDDVAQIEARLARDRAALGQAVRSLRLRLTSATLLQDGLALAAGRGADLGRSAAAMLPQPARWSGPLALGLAAAGLGWLILGRRPKAAAPPAPDPVARWEDDGGMILPATPPVEPPPEHDWLAEADGLRAEASRLLASIPTQSTLGMSADADLSSLRAEVLQALTADVRRVLARGLDHLPDADRKAALLAREEAYARHVARPWPGARIVQNRPLVSGLALFAAGIAAGLALPRSGTEDRQLAALKTELRAEALRLLQDTGWRQITTPPPAS